MAKYFINVDTLEQLWRQYKELLTTYHPDNGGAEEIMKTVIKAINTPVYV